VLFLPFQISFVNFAEGFNVPESNCFDYGGQFIARHVVLTFAFPPLCVAEWRRLVRGSPTNMFEHVTA
jgi:hypothetical protein